MEPIVKRPVGRPRKTPAITVPAKPKGDGLRRAALKAGMLAADVKPYSYPIKPPKLMPGIMLVIKANCHVKTFLSQSTLR